MNNNEKIINDLRLDRENLLLLISKLQSNWNSLREYYKRKAEETKDSTALYDKWTKYSSVLDKMNKLEGKDKE